MDDLGIAEMNLGSEVIPELIAQLNILGTQTLSITGNGLTKEDFVSISLGAVGWVDLILSHIISIIYT